MRKCPPLITLGYDAKITPSNQVAIIEINGKRSGYQGLIKVYGQQIEEVRRQLLLNIMRVRQCELESDMRREPFVNAQNKTKIDQIGGMSLNDRMSNWERSVDADQIADLWEMIDREISLIANDDAEFACLKKSCVAEIQAFQGNKKNGNDIKIVARRLFGITRIGIDIALGLIIQKDMGNKNVSINGIADAYFPELIRRIFKKFPLKHYVPRVLVSEDEDQKCFIHPDLTKVVVEDYLPPLVNPVELETKIESKTQHKEFIPDRNRAPFMIWRGDFRQVNAFLENMIRVGDRLINIGNYPYVVIKVVNGVCGDENHIFMLNERVKMAIFLQKFAKGQAVIEGFVPSKGIALNGDRDNHDGCMRYFIDFVVRPDFQDGYEAVFEKAYYRVAPYDQNDKAVDLDSRFKVNLCKNAIALKPSDEDVQRVKLVVRESIQRILARIVLA